MKRIVIDSDKNYIKAAVMHDAELSEVIVEDKQNLSLVGNIYTGIVKNILPSQFAFIDIGTEKNAFLHLNDMKESGLYNENKKLNVKLGDSVTVQVTKDPTGTKGASVTSQISFQGKYMVLIRNTCACEEIGISKKIVDKKERDRLKKYALKLLGKHCSLIMRTSCKDRSFEEIQAEFLDLYNTSEDILLQAKFAKAPSIVRTEECASIKLTKELIQVDITEIVVGNEKDYKELQAANFLEKDVKIVHYENNGHTAFQKYSIEEQILKALQKKVWLKSGGFLIIEQTEACAVIDVNTGKFMGKKDHENTVAKINFEATAEIAKQIQIRNLAGIIIVDFISMKQGYEELLELMQKELNKCRIRGNVIGMTGLGLMEITRKKSREPLANTMSRVYD